MSERFRSHYHNLIDLAVYRERSHRKGIPVSYLPSIIPRSDGISVFGEGAKFSGITRHGNAEACLTLTASPHVAPTLPVASLVSATEATLGKSVTLPEGMQGDSSVSPQLILWWQEAGAKQPNTDMLRLSRLTPKEIEDFTEGMADLTVKASQIINHVKGPPLVWGSWGNGSPEERAQHGKSRGVPTNNFGHLHISHFDPGEQTFETRSDLPATERLNHYAPWNELFHKEFSVPIARKIETILDNFFGSEEVTDVIPISEFVTYPDGRSGSHFGYQVVCNQPQTFGTIYKILIGMSGTFENYYQRMNTLFEAYHKVPSQPQQRETKKRTIVEESMDFGFTEDEATKIMTFILGIKPTYGQLLQLGT